MLSCALRPCKALRFLMKDRFGFSSGRIGVIKPLTMRRRRGVKQGDIRTKENNSLVHKGLQSGKRDPLAQIKRHKERKTKATLTVIEQNYLAACGGRRGGRVGAGTEKGRYRGTEMKNRWGGTALMLGDSSAPRRWLFPFCLNYFVDCRFEFLWLGFGEQTMNNEGATKIAPQKENVTKKSGLHKNSD